MFVTLKKGSYPTNWQRVALWYSKMRQKNRLKRSIQGKLEHLMQNLHFFFFFLQSSYWLAVWSYVLVKSVVGTQGLTFRHCSVTYVVFQCMLYLIFYTQGKESIK